MLKKMYEAIRKDNGQKIAGTLVEIKGRSFVLPDTLGTIGTSYECRTENHGDFICTMISGFVEVLPETVCEYVPGTKESKHGQIEFEGDFKEPDVSIFKKKQKAWENGFQNWSNEQFGNEKDSYGVCGCGSMCDYCTDNTYGRPCVRALNAMCRDKFINLEYDELTYEDAWCGNFKKARDRNDELSFRLIFVAIVEFCGTAISIYLLCKAKKRQEYIWSIFLLLIYVFSLIADLIKIFNIGV